MSIGNDSATQFIVFKISFTLFTVLTSLYSIQANILLCLYKSEVFLSPGLQWIRKTTILHRKPAKLQGRAHAMQH